MDKFIERPIFKSRWIFAPLYIGLIGLLTMIDRLALGKEENYRFRDCSYRDLLFDFANRLQNAVTVGPELRTEG